MIAWIAALALAGDPVLDALSDELSRSVGELSLPDAQPPYFVAYRLHDVQRVELTAQLGGIFEVAALTPRRRLGVEVRVGSPEHDDSNFESFDPGTRQCGLVIDEGTVALRHDAWLTTDQAYKGAVETLAAKEAAMRRRAEPEPLPDYVPSAPQQAEAQPAEPIEVEAFAQLLRDLSSVFLDHPELELSRVHGAAEHGRRAVIDSYGARVVEPVQHLVVRAAARARADDGTTVVDQVDWVVSRPEDLPSPEAMSAEVEAMAQRLEAWRSWPTIEEEYVGPILFEGDAAVDLIRHVLLPSLQGTPPQEKPPQGSRVVTWDSESGGGPMRVKRRILPRGFTLIDDPGQDMRWPSSYRFDHEGEAAQAVTLVSDGIVRRHLMSRTPSDSAQGSTGHGRGQLGELIRAMPANATLSVDQAWPARRLHRRALRLAADYALDHYVVVRRLAEPAVAQLDSGPIFTVRGMFGFDEVRLPDPVEVVRVFADGREEPVRGVSLSGLDVRSLRDVVGAGATHQRTVLMPTPGRRASVVGGEAVTLSVPDLLLGEAELAPSGGDAERPPTLPSPLAQEGS